MNKTDKNCCPLGAYSHVGEDRLNKLYNVLEDKRNKCQKIGAGIEIPRERDVIILNTKYRIDFLENVTFERRLVKSAGFSVWMPEERTCQ